MPKKSDDAGSKESSRMQGERNPSPLNEEMIEKLRAAVDAAQRKRMQRLNTATDPDQKDP